MRLFLSFVITLLCCSTCFAQPAANRFDKFVDSDLGLTLFYPSSFERVIKPPSSEVVLLLKGPQGGYPSINVIKLVGDPKIAQKSVYDLGTDVVDSYRAVGLIDAEISQSEKKKLADRDVFFTKVSYLMKGSQMAAAVYVVPTLHHYFVFTFVDSKDAYPTTVRIMENIMKGVSLLRDPAPIAPPREDGRVMLYWIAGVFALLFGAWLLSLLLKKPTKVR
jgi:hypothetical protein